MGAYESERGDVEIEVVNTDQAAAWDGHEGDVWTEQADRYERASRRIWQRFLDAQLVGRTDRVLDVGCGTGSSSRDLARVAHDGEVIGLDLSTRMLELARKRSADEGLDNVTFVRGDAQVFPLEPGSLDVAMSSFGVMFFNDPVAAFTNVGAGMRTGGTLAALAWRSLPENEWLMSLRGALALGRELPDASTGRSVAVLARRTRSSPSPAPRGGFDDVDLAPIDEPMDIGTDAADALEFAKTMGIVEGLTDGLDADDRSKVMRNLADLFQTHERSDGVLIGSAAWLITARKR